MSIGSRVGVLERKLELKQHEIMELRKDLELTEFELRRARICTSEALAKVELAKRHLAANGLEMKGSDILPLGIQNLNIMKKPGVTPCTERT